MAEAYDATAAAWAAGPSRLYGRLADVLLDRAPVPVRGAAVLDVGAGTGVVARAALRRGAARVVAADLAFGMLRRCGPRVEVLCADAARLPLADHGVDLVTAGCCLNHVPDPPAVLGELRRVAPALVATTFAATEPHPAKAVVDDVAVRHGWRPPSWYLELKTRVAPRTEDPDRLAALVSAAGYSEVRAEVVAVDTGLASARELAEWRLGMAHLAPYVARLGAAARTALVRDVEAAVAGMPPLIADLLVVSAR